jgi:hypothetical protein
MWLVLTHTMASGLGVKCMVRATLPGLMVTVIKVLGSVEEDTEMVKF